MSDLLTGLVIGLHLASAHFPAKDYHNNENPGIYVRGVNWQVGTYLNTYRRQTFYAAYLHQLGPFELVVGAATGYQTKCETTTHADGSWEKECRGNNGGVLAPLVGLSYTAPFEVLGATPRVLFSYNIVHFTIERKF